MIFRYILRSPQYVASLFFLLKVWDLMKKDYIRAENRVVFI